MSMKRIFIHQPITDISDDICVLDRENTNYIKNVLRHRAGHQIIVFDGASEALGVYDGKNSIKITKMLRENVVQPVLKLAIAHIKQARFEWLVEKATEIGVSEIFLLDTKFSQNKIRNLERARKIAIEAARQCNRVTIPKIHEPIKLDAFIEQHKNEAWAFGAIGEACLNADTPSSHGCAKKRIANNINIYRTNEHNEHNQNIDEKIIGIVIGPEGGFEENESKKLINHFYAVTLSPNILRAETAALVGLIYIFFD